MAAILYSSILDSAILHKTLTATNSIWLKVIHSDLTWWWQSSWIQPFCRKITFTHSFWLNLDWWQPSWILPSHSILDSDKPNSIWLKLIHDSLNCDDGSNLELSSWFPILIFLSFTLAKIGSTNKIWTSLIHSDLTWWWQPSWILSCWIHTLPSWIQTPCHLLSDSLKNTLPPLWLIQSDSNLFILIQLDDGSHLEFCHLEFCHLGFSHFAQNSDSNWFNMTQTHSFSLNSDDVSHLEFCHLEFCCILDSAILLKTLTPTNSIWLKLIHSDSTWWWQPSWILPSWIQTLPSWIQTPCYLLSDSLKNTLTSFWLWLQTNSIWLKLIHSHSTWWWQPSWILPSWILPSWIQTLVIFCTKLWLWLKLIQSHSNFIHSHSNLMMAAILYSAILEFCHLGFRPFCSGTLFSSLRFTLTLN